MYSLLKKTIGVLIFVFGCFDCVKYRIIGFVLWLTTNPLFTLAVLASEFMIFYAFIHCIPFRSFVQSGIADEPWKAYSNCISEDQKKCWSSSESDTVDYDPDNLHWSSSSLSTYLDEVKKDGLLLSRTKPRRHTWVWTSDEDSQDEGYDDAVSGNEDGYVTEMITESDSSCEETDNSCRAQENVSDVSTEMISEMITEMIPVEGEDKDEVTDVIPSCSVEVSTGIVEGADIVKCASDLIFAADEVSANAADSIAVVSDAVDLRESPEASCSSDSIFQSRAVKLGLLAAGVGLGAYIAYRLCSKK